jgi:hypothetical protein
MCSSLGPNVQIPDLRTRSSMYPFLHSGVPFRDLNM